MKRFGTLLVLVLFVLAAVLATGCSRKVPPGYVGIKINFVGAARGVDQMPLLTGKVYYNPWAEDVIVFPTFVQTVVWTRDEDEGSPSNQEIQFSDVDGMKITADVSLSYRLDQNSVPKFYQTFRIPMERFTSENMRNVTRDGFGKVTSTYKVKDILGARKGEILDKVLAYIQAKVDPWGIEVTQLGYVNNLRPPDAVIDSINATTKATQEASRIQNEVAQARAEAEKVVATAKGAADSAIQKARGESEANRMLSSSITPILLQWRRLELEEKRIAVQSIQATKWGGTVPQVVGGGDGKNSMMPLIMPLNISK